MGFGDYPIGLGIDNTFNLQPGIPAPDADLQVAWTKEVFETTHALSRGRKVPLNCPKHIKDCPTMAVFTPFPTIFCSLFPKKRVFSLVPHGISCCSDSSAWCGWCGCCVTCRK
jgi:hypothetical protein